MLLIRCRPRIGIAALIVVATTATAITTVAQDPLDFLTRTQVAEAAFSSGDFEASVRLLSTLETQQPDHPEVLRRLWISLARTGRTADAIVIAERLHKVVGGSRLSYSIATLQARTGNRNAALDWLEQSLRDGYEDRPDIASDEAFSGMKDSDRFRQIAGIAPDSLDRVDGWRFDLAYLVEEVKRLHASPERPGHTAEFTNAVDDLRRRIPTLTDEETLLEFMRLAAMLNDGHTAIYGPSDGSPLSIEAGALPVLFYYFSDGLYVVDSSPDWRHLVGARVERIGPLSPTEMLERLHTFRGVDNHMTMKWLGVHFYLRRTLMLKGIGATTNSNEALLTLTLPGGDSTTVEMAGGNHEFRRKLRAPTATTGSTPRYLRHVDTNYWMDFLSEECTLYLQFNQVRNADNGPSIEDFSAMLTDSLKSSDVKHLIVDVRHNNGGNNSLLRPLLRTLVDFDMEKGHSLFVFMGRNTFSAAQNYINRVERLTDAVFVGEPSSSSPNFVGEETNLDLPWSRVRGSVSSRYWQDSDPWDHRRWIPPDIPVELSSTDYFAGRDPALEVIAPLLGCPE